MDQECGLSSAFLCYRSLGQASNSTLADCRESRASTFACDWCRHAAAQAALDARNARFRNVASKSRDLDDDDSSNRVEKAEKRVGEFVARRLSPAVQRVRKTPVRRWFSGVRSGAGYVGGLWGRLAFCA